MGVPSAQHFLLLWLEPLTILGYYNITLSQWPLGLVNHMIWWTQTSTVHSSHEDPRFPITPHIVHTTLLTLQTGYTFTRAFEHTKFWKYFWVAKNPERFTTFCINSTYSMLINSNAWEHSNKKHPNWSNYYLRMQCGLNPGRKSGPHSTSVPTNKIKSMQSTDI